MRGHIDERVDFLTAAEAERRAAGEEERRVGAQGRSEFPEQRERRASPQAGECDEGGRGIRAPAAETGLKWDLLVDRNGRVAHVAGAPERRPQRSGCLPD